MGGACRTVGRGEVQIGIWWGNLGQRDHLEDLSVDGMIILRWIFRKWDGWHGLNLSGLGYGQVDGSCESGNELSGSTICG